MKYIMNSDDKCDDASKAHKDSLTNIINDVIEKHALKVSDIRKLKKGETIKVYLFDRNIGDHNHGTKKGTTLSTIDYLNSFHLTEYTQKDKGGLTGKLYMNTIYETFENWTWEINTAKW